MAFLAAGAAGSARMVPGRDGGTLCCASRTLATKSTIGVARLPEASRASVAALTSAGPGGRTFVGCDGTPVTRGELMALVEASGKFGPGSVTWTAAEGPLGRKMTNSRTRAELNWAPKYASWGFFVAATPALAAAQK